MYFTAFTICCDTAYSKYLQVFLHHLSRKKKSLREMYTIRYHSIVGALDVWTIATVYHAIRHSEMI